MGNLFGYYAFRRFRYGMANKRRTVSLTLSDGPTRTLIELEDGRTFSEAHKIAEEHYRNSVRLFLRVLTHPPRSRLVQNAYWYSMR